MVKLTRIYTKSGDKGKTSLGNGKRILKHSLRVCAYGTVDEINASIGLARVYSKGKIDDILGSIQNDLFDLGADLCIPGDATTNESNRKFLRIVTKQTNRLESEIDFMNEKLNDLQSFILPGGSILSSHLHIARTITRRAERIIVELSETESINTEAIKYINRLSDYLFVLARYCNDLGKNDILWKPALTQ